MINDNALNHDVGMLTQRSGLSNHEGVQRRKGFQGRLCASRESLLDSEPTLGASHLLQAFHSGVFPMAGRPDSAGIYLCLTSCQLVAHMEAQVRHMQIAGKADNRLNRMKAGKKD